MGEEFEAVDMGRKLKVNLSATLHRGAKWSAAHNVPPCTQGFGLCNIRVGLGLDRNILVDDLENGYFDIELLENVGASNGDIFISADDDDIVLAPDVAAKLGYSAVTILAMNYVTVVNSTYPNGFIKVKVVTVP